MVSIPPQHGKSYTILNHLVRLSWLKPTWRNAYVTYGAEFSFSQQEIARTFHNNLDVVLEHQTQHQWSTKSRGRIYWLGIGGRFTGLPVDGILIIDDPYSGREQAESPAYRRRVTNFWRGTALPRTHKEASVMVVQARWVDEDLAGVLAEDGWEVINLPALKEKDGQITSLWPVKWPVEFLQKRRQDIGEYDFSSLYQGRPVARGDRVFKDTHYYSELPTEGFRRLAGADWAYTDSTRADRSVAIDAIHYQDKIYVTNMIAGHYESPTFIGRLTELAAEDILTLIAGTEKSVVQWANRNFQNLEVRHRVIEEFKVEDKYTAAQPLIQLWNEGGVLLPDPEQFPEAYEHKPGELSWPQDLAKEVHGFTGAKGSERDDVVDALVPLARRIFSTMNADHLARLSGRVPRHRRPEHLPRRVEATSEGT